MIAELRRAVAHCAHALDELNVPEPEAVLTEDTTYSFTMPGLGVLGPATRRAAVLDFVRDGHTAARSACVGRAVDGGSPGSP